MTHPDTRPRWRGSSPRPSWRRRRAPAGNGPRASQMTAAATGLATMAYPEVTAAPRTVVSTPEAAGMTGRFGSRLVMRPRPRSRALPGMGSAGAAYVPQISHLVKARCSAGISRGLWGVAAGVGFGYNTRGRHRRRRLHRTRRDPDRGHGARPGLCGPVQGHALPKPSAWPARGQDSRGTGTRETSPVSGVRPVGRWPPQPHPPGTTGTAAHRPRPAPAIPRGH